MVHGLSIPLGKLGFFLPRTLSRAWTSSPGASSIDIAPIGGHPNPTGIAGVLRERRRRRASPTALSGASTPTQSTATSSRPIYRIGGTVIRDREQESSSGDVPLREGLRPAVAGDGTATPPQVAYGRTIRFPDEQAAV